MASPQFQMFLGYSDQKIVDEAIRASGDIVFIKNTGSSLVPELLDSSLTNRIGEYCFQIMIAQRRDVDRIRMKRIRDGLFSLDVSTEPIIEFDRCRVTDEKIGHGRFYRNDRFWNESDMLVQKSPEFVQWASRLFMRVKKRLTMISPGYYAGPEALELRRAGAFFEHFDPPPRRH